VLLLFFSLYHVVLNVVVVVADHFNVVVADHLSHLGQRLSLLHRLQPYHFHAAVDSYCHRHLELYGAAHLKLFEFQRHHLELYPLLFFYTLMLLLSFDFDV
jgi:hypothetical protein